MTRHTGHVYQGNEAITGDILMSNQNVGFRGYWHQKADGMHGNPPQGKHSY